MREREREVEREREGERERYIYVYIYIYTVVFQKGRCINNVDSKRWIHISDDLQSADTQSTHTTSINGVDLHPINCGGVALPHGFAPLMFETVLELVGEIG